MLNLITAAPIPIARSAVGLLSICSKSGEEIALRIAEMGGSEFLAEAVRRDEVQEDEEMLESVLKTLGSCSDIGRGTLCSKLMRADAMIEDILDKETLKAIVKILRDSNKASIISEASFCLLEALKRETDGKCLLHNWNQ